MHASKVVEAVDKNGSQITGGQWNPYTDRWRFGGE